MWTHNIVKKTTQDGNAIVGVEYADGAAVIRETYRSQGATLEWVKGMISRRLSELEANDAFIKSLPLGTIDLAPVVVPPTQEELDKRHYFGLLEKWNRIEEDIGNGLIAVDHPDVVKLEADLKSAYKPEYSGL